MGLFSFLRKKQQESSVGNSDFYSQADVEQPSGRSKRKQSNKRTEAVDPVLPEKKRARRRLIGAIALVLAAVIGLPMILDSEPKPLADDINIQIPSKDTAAPIAQSKSSTTQKNSQPTAESLSPDEEVIEAPASQVAAKTEVKPEEKPEVKPVEPDKRPQIAKVEIPEHKVASPPTIANTDHSDEAARARAILDGKANVAAPKASGKIVLQIAALASQDKVNELQKKLQGAGLKSFTQKVATESGERIRVRVGPFANESEAEKARAKLTKLGLTGKQVPA
jgi:DedD protein